MLWKRVRGSGIHRECNVDGVEKEDNQPEGNRLRRGKEVENRG
jgi:hypothetical protein